MTSNSDINFSDHLYGMEQIIGNIVGDNSNVEIQQQQIKEVLQEVMKQDGVLDMSSIGKPLSNEYLNIDSILNEGKDQKMLSITEMAANNAGEFSDGQLMGLLDTKTSSMPSHYNNNKHSPFTQPMGGKNSAPVAASSLSEHDGFNVLSSFVNDYNSKTNDISFNKAAGGDGGNFLMQKSSSGNEVGVINTNIINKIVENEDRVDYRELINTLRNALESEGENVSDIPQVTGNESMEVLADIYKILDRRYNRKVDYEIGEGVFTSVAKVIEDTFDGTKTLFNSKPNLKGLTPKVQKTISHMKIETANEVARIRNKYFPGFFGRFLLSIAPTIYLLMSNNAEREAEILLNGGNENFTETDLRNSLSNTIN
jgi:hypothetical protein